ncbi:ZBT22 protein, partial [Polypterus senegalus]
MKLLLPLPRFRGGRACGSQWRSNGDYWVETAGTDVQDRKHWSAPATLVYTMMMTEQSSAGCSSTSHCYASQPGKTSKIRGQANSSVDVVHVDFPDVPASLLDSLNQQRVEGKLCDLSIHVQGQIFRAHRCVLAASSPYFHDQVMLKNVSSVVLPSVMDPYAFESVLGSAYTGKLSMASDEIINYVTVGSFLQMWHVVDKCTELLRESSLTGASHSLRPHSSSRNVEHQSPSSTNYYSPRETPSGINTVEHITDGMASGHRHSRHDVSDSVGSSPPPVIPPLSSHPRNMPAQSSWGENNNTPSTSQTAYNEKRWLIGRQQTSIEFECSESSAYSEEMGLSNRGVGLHYDSARSKQLSLCDETRIGMGRRSRNKSLNKMKYRNLASRMPSCVSLASPTGSAQQAHPQVTGASRLRGVRHSLRRTSVKRDTRSANQESGLVLTCDDDEQVKDREIIERADGLLDHEVRNHSDPEITTDRKDPSLGDVMVADITNEQDRELLGHHTSQAQQRHWVEQQQQQVMGASGVQGLEQPSSLEDNDQDDSEVDDAHAFSYHQISNPSQYGRLPGQTSGSKRQILDVQHHQPPSLSQHSHPAPFSGTFSSGGLDEQVNFCESSQDFATTYDEIEEGTGQVSQRPLLQHPSELSGSSMLAYGAGPQGIIPPTSSAGGTGFGLSQCSSSPLEQTGTGMAAAAPGTAGYSGKVHFCLCGKAYNLKSMRDRHVKMQHLNLRPFACPVCEKMFKMKHHLTKHLKTHAGLEPFECEICGKKLMWRDSFLRHKAHCEKLAAAEIAAATSVTMAGSSASEVKEEVVDRLQREEDDDESLLYPAGGGNYFMKEETEEVKEEGEELQDQSESSVHEEDVFV